MSSSTRRRFVKCADPKCDREIRPNVTGFCQDCHNRRRAEASGLGPSAAKHQAERLARKAAGEESPIDLARAENVDLRNALVSANAIIKQHDERAKFEDALLREVTDLIKRSPYRPQFKAPRPHEGRAKAADHEMLLLLSDAHFPEVVNPDEAMGLAYNPGVCRRRIECVRDVVLRYRDLRSTSYPVRKLSVAVVGDMLSGDIHEELTTTNALPASEALVQMAYMLHEFAVAMAEAFPVVELIFMPGNHPRLTKKPTAKLKWNNWEYVLGRFVGALGGKHYTTQVPKQIIYQHKVFGFNIGLTHGDGVKAASFAGIPWYSMKLRRDALQALLKTLGTPQLDLLCYGHFHQLIFEEGAGCSLIINGTIKGGDEHGIGSRYQAPPAIQGLLTFHAKHGITDLSRINLSDVR